MNQVIEDSLFSQVKNILYAINNLNHKRKDVMLLQTDIKITKRFLSSIKTKKSINFLNSKEINDLILNLTFLKHEFFSQDHNFCQQIENFNILLKKRLDFQILIR